MMSQHEIFRQMRDVFAELYLDQVSARRVAEEAGLDPRFVAFSPKAVNNWYVILEEAKRYDRVSELLEIAVSEFPKKQKLLDGRAVYLEWVMAGRPLSERERQFQRLADVYHLAPHDEGAVSVTTGLLSRLDVVLNKHTLFGGRNEELVRLDAFLAEQPNGYLFVTGQSGFGKSALLANWIKALQAKQQAVCYTFINRSEDVADPKFTMQNLCEQLAAYHGLGGILPPQETTLRALYPQLLQIPPERDHKLVVVLDGLDEALDWKPHSDLFPLDLPVGVYVVFSARALPEMDWLATLGISDNAIAPLELKTMDLHKIESLLRKAGDRAAGLAEEADFVKAVYDVSQGDPFYLHFLVQDIRNGDITEANIKEQPDKIDEYLEKWWEQLSADVNLNEVYDLLGILSVAKGRLLPGDFAGISPNLRKGALLKKELSGKLRRYLSGDQKSGYAIAHPRFGQYLIKKKFADYEVQDYQNQLLDYCARWHEHRSIYALAHYAQHLVDAAETEQLAKLTGDRTFQEAHISVVNDLPALQADLERALKATADDRRPEALPLVIESALALVDLRVRELRPEPIFELARQGEVEVARGRLKLFDIDAEWRKAILLTIAWLAREKDEHAALNLFEDVQSEQPKGRPLRLLWDWVSASLKGTSPPEPELDPAPPEDQIHFAVERIKGSGDLELLHSRGLGTLGLSELGYLAKQDGPPLVAFAAENPKEGDRYLNQYIAMHTGYSYVYYRNRSLWILLDAVVCHFSSKWVRNTVEKLAVAALASSGADFREGFPITIQALQARQQDQYEEFDTLLNKAVFEAEQLSPGSRHGDITGDHKRRLAAFAEVLARLLNRPTDADKLLDQAQHLQYGFAGYGMPAYLALAEAVRICRPGDHTAIEKVLNAAQESAHNIQDATFCARSTARFNAIQEFWWRPSGIDDLQAIATRLCDDPSTPDFAGLHRIDESYDKRIQVSKLPLPPRMRAANTLQALADVYKRPVTEFQRLNREQGWAVDQELVIGTPVRVPDPGFAPLLAARFAAEALVELSLEARRDLIRSLAPVAAANPTALDTVLVRLLLADPPSDSVTLDKLGAMKGNQL